MRAKKSRIGAVSFSAVLLAALSACSSGTGKSSSSPSLSAPTSDASLQGAINDVAKAASVPSNIGYNVALSKSVPSGKKVAIANCGVGACVTYANAASDAAKVLGWNVTMVSEGSTVATITAAWNQIVQLKPDVVIENGGSYDIVSSQRAKLSQLHIPIVWSTDPNPSTSDIVHTDGSNADEATASLQAKYILSRTGLKSNVLEVQIPQYAATVANSKLLTRTLHQYCSSCSAATLDLGVSDLGNGQNVTKIVGYLRAHPDVNFVASAGAFVRGLWDALSRASLSNVQLAVWSASAEDVAAIAAGKAESAVALPGVEIGWKLIDIAARLVVGDSTDPATSVVIPRPLITKDNLISEPYVPTMISDYKKMWHVTT